MQPAIIRLPSSPVGPAGNLKTPELVRANVLTRYSCAEFDIDPSISTAVGIFHHLECLESRRVEGKGEEGRDGRRRRKKRKTSITSREYRMLYDFSFAFQCIIRRHYRRISRRTYCTDVYDVWRSRIQNGWDASRLAKQKRRAIVCYDFFSSSSFRMKCLSSREWR